VVANTVKIEGTEIVQVYVRKVNDTDGPMKTLRGFKRVSLAAGKSTNCTIELPYEAFEFYDNKSLSMAVVAGEYEIWYGNSSD
jgi:beta-glucosidase